MRQCDRCGEPNHDDARYCGSCGLAMPAAAGLGALADDTPEPDDEAPVLYDDAPGPDDDTPVGLGLGAATQVIPEVVPVPIVNSARSASLMFAMLVVAAVVIIGGVFVLLASGSGGETARTGELPTVPVPGSDIVETSTSVAVIEPVQTEAPETVPPETEPPPETVTPETAPLDSAPPDTAAPETTPVDITPAETTPPDTAPADTTPATTSAPATTATPEPDPTTTTSVPSVGAGDLGLSQPILDESCDGRYITFVGSALGDQPYGPVVESLLDRYPGTGYLWTKSCPSLRQELSDGTDIYGVVFGPFATPEEACDARASGPDDAYVRRISTTDPETHTVDC